MLLLGAACSGDSEADSKQLADLKAQLATLKKQERAAKTELAVIEEEGTSGTTTSTTEATSTVSPDASAVGIVFYREEFKVTVLSTQVTPDPDTPTRATLDIKLECENIGVADGYCPGDARIESGQEFYSPSSIDTPLVPSGRVGKGAYAFRVDDKFSLATAVLRVGSAPRHVVVIPLCPGKGSPDTVTLAPVQLPASGVIEAGQVTTTIKGMTLTPDYPDHRTRDAKNLTMYLTVDTVAKVSEEYKGYYFEARSYSLKLPNGNTAEAEDWTIESGFINADRTETGVVLRFEISNPPAGSYTLQYKPTRGNGIEPEPGTLTLTI